MEKSSPEIVELFGRVAPNAPDVEHKTMFGYPSCFTGGNLFTGLHGNSMILRLNDSDRRQFLEAYGAQLFEPMPGRPMKEYVVVPDSLCANEPLLSTWIQKSLSHARAMPLKQPKKKSKK